MQILVEAPGHGLRAVKIDQNQTLAQIDENFYQVFSDANLDQIDTDHHVYFSHGAKPFNRIPEFDQLESQDQNSQKNDRFQPLYPHANSGQDDTDHEIYFTYGGKPFNRNCRINELGLRENSVLQIRVRVCGGGGDGGATGAESRDCYLKMYATKKPDKVNPNESRLCKWTTCALSQESLKPPCVLDRLENIFNKESLVRALLTKSLPPQFSHIKGLKDMVPVHLETIKGIDADSDDFVTKFQCPVTGHEFNGKYKFFALGKCGHILSAKAVKEVQTNSCLIFHAEFEESDKIVINGNKEEVDFLRSRMEAAERCKKKSRSKNGVKAGDNGGEVDALKRKANTDEEFTGGRDKAKPNVKKFKATDLAPVNATKEIYASIFTSSRKKDLKETYSCRALPLGRN